MNGSPPAYAEMAAATNFSFLRGASPAADMVLAALLLGHAGLGVADRNTVAGVVRAWAALKELREEGLPPAMKLREGSGPGEWRHERRALGETRPRPSACPRWSGSGRPASGWPRARASPSRTGRPTSSPIRRTAPDGAGSAGC